MGGDQAHQELHRACRANQKAKPLAPGHSKRRSANALEEDAGRYRAWHVDEAGAFLWAPSSAVRPDVAVSVHVRQRPMSAAAAFFELHCYIAQTTCRVQDKGHTSSLIPRRQSFPNWGPKREKNAPADSRCNIHQGPSPPSPRIGAPFPRFLRLSASSRTNQRPNRWIGLPIVEAIHKPP